MGNEPRRVSEKPRRTRAVPDSDDSGAYDPAENVIASSSRGGGVTGGKKAKIEGDVLELGEKLLVLVRDQHGEAFPVCVELPISQGSPPPQVWVGNDPRVSPVPHLVQVSQWIGPHIADKRI